jgi:hypothetical protein
VWTGRACPALGLAAGAEVEPVIEAMIAGERDPRVHAALGQGRMRNDKLPALAEALSGMRFGPQHAHAAASLLRSIDFLDAELRELQERVTAHLAAIPGSWGVDCGAVTGPGAGRVGGAAALPAADRLDEIPGLGATGTPSTPTAAAKPATPAASSRPSATTSSSPCGRKPPDPRSLDNRITVTTPRAALATGHLVMPGTRSRWTAEVVISWSARSLRPSHPADQRLWASRLVSGSWPAARRLGRYDPGSFWSGDNLGLPHGFRLGGEIPVHLPAG